MMPEDDDPIPQTAAAGQGPPSPPRGVASATGDEPPERRVIELPDPVSVTVLAEKLKQEPFRVIAELIRYKTFRSGWGSVEFEIAAKVAEKADYRAVRVGERE